MYTGNEDGLKIAREHARMPALETKIDGLERQRKTDIEALKRDIEALKRQLTTDSEALKRQLSELHNAFNRQAQQTDLRLSLCCPDIRCRFLSTFRRDFMGDNSRENQKVIDQGNITAHHGFFMADATLYDSEGFTNQDGQHVPPRTDQDTFKRLYGVLPSLAKKINYTPTVQVLERHATVCASPNSQIPPQFNEKFQAFIHALEATNYAGDYLDSQSDQVIDLLSAYEAFWKVCP